jgi:hypothetical protein
VHSPGRMAGVRKKERERKKERKREKGGEGRS